MDMQVPSRSPPARPWARPGAHRPGQHGHDASTTCARVLTLKYLAGMFDHPLTDPARVRRSAELTPAHLAAARTMAARSMVLLQRDGNAHAAEHRRILGGGRRAARQRPRRPGSGRTCRSGTRSTRAWCSVLDGIKAAVPGATGGTPQGCDTSSTSTAGFGAAVSAAQASAVTVVVVGEPAADSGEASSRSDISLPGQQLALVQAIAATGKPYVVVMMNGRPLTISWLADNAPALLESRSPAPRAATRSRTYCSAGEPGREAADELPPQRRANPHLLQRTASQPPTIRTTSTPPGTSTCPTRRSTRSDTACLTPPSPCRTCTCRRAAFRPAAR